MSNVVMWALEEKKESRRQSVENKSLCQQKYQVWSRLYVHLRRVFLLCFIFSENK